ncbi:hypothetical protein HDU84_000422 [Entophlyctis sp. JEL0112]|nr:hypothetical protein HDU84_000422 [Entophlyctis sp. JEL0112]
MMMESEIFSQLRSGINNDLTVSLADVQPDPVFPAAAAADASPDDDNDSADEANGVEHHENMHTDIDLASDDLFPALPAASAAPTTRKPLSASWRPAVSKQPELVPGTVRKLGSGKRVSEAVHIPLDMQQKLPSVGRNSIPDLAKAIALHSQTTIDVSANRSTFVITGKPESIKVARKELVSAIGVVLTETVHVPASVRPHILGAGGKNLKDLISRTGVQITVPKPKADSASPTASSTAFDDDDDQPVTIKGNYEGVKEARKEIEDIVLKRTQNLSSRLIIERSFHPFIAGPNNSTVEAIEEKTGTRIHIPPLVTPAPAANSEKKEKNLNEIVIVGSRESIRFAEAELRALHEKLERDTQTLAFPVKKRQHRFIIGTKGKNLQDILEQTGCSVELPSASDPSDMVTVRGPDNMLSVALQFVLQKSNQVSLEEIDVSSIIPQSLDPAHFLRFVFTKEQALIKRIESAHSVSIHRLTASGSSASSGDSFVLEIQGKTKAEAEAAKIELSAALRDMARTLYFGHVEIPRGLHRHVVGKGGQNIARMRALEAWGGRLVDVVVHGESASVEGTAAEDEVVIVARRQIINPKSAAAKGKSAAALAEEEEEEARAFVEKVRDEILSVSLASAEFTSETIRVDGKFHGRIIGAGGKDLKELLAPYGDEVSVRFPPASGVGIADKEKKEENGPAPATTNKKMTIEPNTIVIRGPKKLVAEVKDILTKTIAELKRIETLASFSDTLKVKKGLGRKLLQGAGAPVSAGSNIVNDSGFGGGNRDSIGWLIRLVKESLAANPPKQAGDVTHEDTHLIALLKVTVAESTTSSGDDVLTVTGPKNLVLTAKKILADRAVRLASQVTVEVKIFTACSAAARAVLSENAVADLKDRVLRRLIGKGGKNVNALMEKYAVSVQFPESGNKKKRNGAVKADEAEDDGADVDGDDSTASDDLVVIKGSPKDVEAAKAEIMKTVENEV